MSVSTDASSCMNLTFQERDLLDISEDTMMSIIFITMAVSAFIGLAGFVLNLVNIAVFVRLGFGEPTNVTLLGLAVADAGSLLFLAGNVALFNPVMLQAVDPQVLRSISYLTLNNLHVCFLQISGFCTALVALERFLCVAVPHRIRSLVTPRRAFAANIGVFLFIACNKLLIDIGYGITASEAANKAANKTIFDLIRAPVSEQTENFSNIVDVCTQMVAFPAVVLLTGGIIHLYRQKTRWRLSVTFLDPNKTTSSKERRMVKVVIFISLLYIACLLPSFLATLVFLTCKEFSLAGKYSYLFMATFSVLFILDAINSAGTFFIYLHMSTKFRTALKTFSILCIRKSSKAKMQRK